VYANTIGPCLLVFCILPLWSHAFPSTAIPTFSLPSFETGRDLGLVCTFCMLVDHYFSDKSHADWIVKHGPLRMVNNMFITGCRHSWKDVTCTSPFHLFLPLVQVAGVQPTVLSRDCSHLTLMHNSLSVLNTAH
jgi:hypothetical protein